MITHHKVNKTLYDVCAKRFKYNCKRKKAYSKLIITYHKVIKSKYTVIVKF